MAVVFDFETEEIKPYPEYPPKPVGISILVDDEEPRYLAFGHPEGNNCTEDEARKTLAKYWTDPEIELIAFNSPFDALVASVHWNMDIQPAGKLHDGMVLAFLLDPHAYELGLKPQAEKHLGMPPDERDEVREWLVSHGVCKDNSKWGAHICKAPGGLVGKYANGDTIRTKLLFELQYAKVVESQMLGAYERELALQPIMLQNSIEGICVDVPRLTADIKMYEDALEKLDAKIFDMLNTAPFNIGSGAQLADAIDKAVPDIVWPKTPTGKRSTSKATLDLVLGQLKGELLACLQYRASVTTCVNTFMREWLRQATEGGDGRIRCQWRTTRSDDGGARTGRLSSSPNFMNIPTLKSAKFTRCVELWAEWLEQQGFPALPNVRSYIIAAPGCKLVSLDYASQELKVLAHYEDGDLLAAYKENKDLDMHQWICDEIHKLVNMVITRKQSKTVAFAVIYGSGLATLAGSMGCDADTAAIIKDAYMTAVPGIDKVSKRLKARARNNQPIRTWGGRLYYVEPPKWSAKYGRMQSFDYKLLNVLIQGSSADITKESIIEYCHNKEHGRFLLTVHDQNVIEVPEEWALYEAYILRECMESIKLDAPLPTDGSIGDNLHDMQDFKWQD